MKCLSIICVSLVLATACLVNAKPFVSINADIPIPIPAGFGSTISGSDSENSKPDSSKEVETMDKAESAYYGYYPYYYGGWPHYGYRYPLVYIGK